MWDVSLFPPSSFMLCGLLTWPTDHKELPPFLPLFRQIDCVTSFALVSKNPNETACAQTRLRVRGHEPRSLSITYGTHSHHHHAITGTRSLFNP